MLVKNGFITFRKRIESNFNPKTGSFETIEIKEVTEPFDEVHLDSLKTQIDKWNPNEFEIRRKISFTRYSNKLNKRVLVYSFHQLMSTIENYKMIIKNSFVEFKNDNAHVIIEKRILIKDLKFQNEKK